MPDHFHGIVHIIGGVMRLNAIGKIVEKCWYEIPNHFNNCKLDAFILMSDHVHGIIKICENNAIVGNRHACSVRRQYQTIIIRGFKSASFKLIHQLGYHDFKWHKEQAPTPRLRGGGRRDKYFLLNKDNEKNTALSAQLV